MPTPRLLVQATSTCPKFLQSSRPFPKKLVRIPAPQTRPLSTPSPAPPPPQTPDDSQDFFNYTYGRFLWREPQQLRARHRAFNAAALQAVAAQAAGAQSCVSMRKVWETDYFKLFRLVLDDGREVEARVPHPNAGAARYTTASEVATMAFARDVLGVPAPRVLAWSSAPEEENAVGAEYVVTEKVEGTKLVYLWGEMSLYEKERIIDELVEIEKRFLKVEFSKSGAIYYANEGLPGCEEVEITGDFSEDVRESLSRFAIGPTTEREFWKNGKSDMDLNRGPWRTAQDYFESIAHNEIAWLRRFATPDSLDMTNRWSVSYNQRIPEAHIEMLRKYLSVIPLVTPKDPDLISFRLWNSELHDQNVLVHEGKITCIFDWQAISVRPLFHSASVPHCIRYAGDLMLELPDNFNELDDEEKAEMRDTVSRSISSRLYSQKTEAQNPLLHKTLTHPHCDRIGELIACAEGTWDGDLVRLREILKRLERDWETLGIDAPCPYHFSAAELEKHRESAEGFNQSQDLWQQFSDKNMLRRDGWVFHETFELLVEMFAGLRDDGLRDCKNDPECTEEQWNDLEEATRWVLEHKRKGGGGEAVSSG